MLFITNRAFEQGKKSEADRKVSFALDDNEAQQSIYFCRRDGKDDYTEIMSGAFMEALRESRAEQLLLFVHGYSNLPEPDIFPRATALQKLFDKHRKNMVEVVPVIWPCDNDFGIAKDYFDDQKAADASRFAFARALQIFAAWRADKDTRDNPCLKRINVLAHSMGNRVFRGALDAWEHYYQPGGAMLLFRNSFLVAADIVNESLARGGPGQAITRASRNVAVYFASDDLALRSSKVANLANEVASRRLGHTGPEDMSLVPKNVYAIDCDDLNTRYDMPKGHSYFLYDEAGQSKKRPGEVFSHICTAVDSGRIDVGDDPAKRTVILKAPARRTRSRARSK